MESQDGSLISLHPVRLMEIDMSQIPDTATREKTTGRYSMAILPGISVSSAEVFLAGLRKANDLERYAIAALDQGLPEE